MADFTIKPLSQFTPASGTPDTASAYQFSVEDVKGEQIGFINQHGDAYYVMHVFDGVPHYSDDIEEFRRFLRANWPLAYYKRKEIYSYAPVPKRSH